MMTNLQKLRAAVYDVLEENTHYSSDKEGWEGEKQAIKNLRCALLNLIDERFPNPE